jgi:GNAT superfamily N-acetyltransferase
LRNELGYDRVMVPTSPDHPRPLCEIETHLADGRQVCLRTIRPSDEARIREGISEMSDRSRYLRFFSAFREPPESVVKQLSAVDGHDHIGWGAILLDGGEFPPIGAAHAIRLDPASCEGELSIAVLDEYQGFGLARKLVAALLADCAAENIESLQIQVLGENRAASGLVRALGAAREVTLGGVEHYRLDVAKTLATMSQPGSKSGTDAILQQLAVM